MSTPTPTPFQIAVPQDALDLVKQKLALASFPPPAPASDDPWKYGVPLEDVTRIVEYWKTQYDWRKHEAVINSELPQFTLPVEVEGHGTFKAHFVHQKAQRTGKTKAIPLLFLHGWPGHFDEVRKILPLLTNPEGEDDLVFDVVAPSLPGFGFTSAPTKPGFAINQYAEFANNVMLALGYDKYVVQGGDWGYIIGRRVVYLYGPKHAKAWHTNFPVTGPPTLTESPRLFLSHLISRWSEEEKKGLGRSMWYNQRASGYNKLQSTTPQTLAYSLADSPVGLLAWIYERLVQWTDGYPWTEDEVLTWIHIYLFSHTQNTSSAATSLRIYFEANEAGDLGRGGSPAFYNGNVPLGVSIFPKELIVVPESWHHNIGLVVYSARHEHGGHLAAFEHPKELVKDIRKTFSTPAVRAKL